MLRDTSENISEKWPLHQLKQEIISSITKQVGEGAEVKATSIEDETFRDEIKNTASRWRKEITNKAQVVVLVPTGIYAFDKFFNLPDLDITFFGIGSHRYFLFHSGAAAWILKTLYEARLKKVENDKTIMTKVVNKILGVTAASGCVAIGCHLLTDVTQPKSIVFPFFGSLVSDTLIDDNIWMLGNSVYCFKVANDLYTLALGDDFKLVKNFVKENFFEPLIRIKK